MLEILLDHCEKTGEPSGREETYTIVKVSWVLSLQSQESVLAELATELGQLGVEFKEADNLPHQELAVGFVTERPWTAVKPAKEAARMKCVRATMMTAAELESNLLRTEGARRRTYKRA